MFYVGFCIAFGELFTYLLLTFKYNKKCCLYHCISSSQNYVFYTKSHF
jgi:hypothetical protein